MQAIKFRLEEMPEGPNHPAHWRMFALENPSHVLAWGQPDSFELMKMLVQLASIGLRRSTPSELIELGIAVKPKIIKPNEV